MQRGGKRVARGSRRDLLDARANRFCRKSSAGAFRHPSLTRSLNRTRGQGLNNALTIVSIYWNILAVSYSLTKPQKTLVRELLKIGRWNNESEIIRYGLHLVVQEVRAEQVLSLEPYRPGALARAYNKLTPADRREEQLMERASALPQTGDLE